MLNRFNKQINKFIRVSRNVNASIGVNGMTALAYAVKMGSVTSVRKLLDHGARVNRKILDNGKLITLAEYEIMYGSPPTFKVLLQHGLNVNGDMLVLAMKLGKNNMAELLLRGGVNVNTRKIIARTIPGNTRARYIYTVLTPLHIAVSRDNIDGVKLLLEHNANVKSVDEKKNTPLHIAVKRGNLEIIKLLLRHRASLFIKNNEGKTPIDVAQGPGIRILQGAVRSRLENLMAIRRHT